MLVVVLWVALGLVSITLYFANSMTFELRASDNRVSALIADQTIDAAARYVSYVLANIATNGLAPDVTTYQSEAVPVGDSHFWLIGRPVDYQVQPDQVFFGLVDEASKLNLNTATPAMLGMLTNVSLELAANIADWRSTNGTTSANGDGPTVYSLLVPAYLPKMSNYETVDELRLVYAMDMGILFGEDRNLNGALDPGELDTNRNNVVDCGILEHVTVYSREPNTSAADGSSKVNVGRLSSNSTTELMSLLQTNLSAARASQVLAQLGLMGTGGGGGSGRQGQGSGGSGGQGQPGQGQGGGRAGGGQGGSSATVVTITFQSPLAFYRRSGLSADEFTLIADSITVTNAESIEGRLNVNTASAAVLSCLPGITPDLAQQLVLYRRSNPSALGSIAWVVEALQNNASALDTLQGGDYITTHSYQFTADVAALGPHGRGYRRVMFVFDTSSGTPRMIYRQALSHLGWALGKYVRQGWLLAKDTR